jgi:hypothetical protein
MGGKKKAKGGGKGGGKGKKGGAPEEEIPYLENFMKAYRKELREYEEVPMSKQIKKMFEEAEEEGEMEIKKFHLHEELGWEGTKAIMDSLVTAK